MASLESWGEQPRPEIRHALMRCYCPHCDFSPGCKLENGKLVDREKVGTVIGISTKPYISSKEHPMAVVYECNRCFQKYWIHVTEEHAFSLSNSSRTRE